MRELLLRRLLTLLLVVWGICTILFLLLRVSGDPVTALLGADNPSPEVEAAIRKAYGLDQPLHIQYVRFLGGVATLDFGESFQTKKDAMGLVLERIPASLQLTVAAMLFSITVALPIGVIAATQRRSPASAGIMAVGLLGQSTPTFALGLLLIFFLAVKFGWFPAVGAGSPRHLVLPALTLAGPLLAKLVRLIRNGLLEVLGQDYIRTAHAKGAGFSRVIWRHAMRNMLIPVVTLIGLEFSYMLGGAVIVESIFAWPGVGRQLLNAVTARDYNVVQASVFVIACIAVLANTLVDVAYRYLDPRISYD